VPIPFNEKIKQLCTDTQIFIQYKNDARLTLDLTTTDKAKLDKKRREQFYFIRGKFDLENKGIDAFTKE